jgi:hypothetical protein
MSFKMFLRKVWLRKNFSLYLNYGVLKYMLRMRDTGEKR